MAAPSGDTLVSWALEAGFDHAGVARLAPTEQGEVYLRWLERGDHAGMGWLARQVEERLDPRRLLPGARSVLCVGLVYHPLAGDGEGGSAPEPAGDLWPRVARYARGRDYHNLMGKRLRRLARRLREAVPGVGTRTAVDTSPVLERELAARAGVGVQGKNTCLLSREAGSWFLLGELFTTLELDPAEPLADLCGRCTRCLDACPTGALPAPWRLDANRCISYWTIEHRGAVPAAVRPLLDDWVFGCDVCQEVCPWNLRYDRRPDRGERRPADHPDLALPVHRARLDLTGLLALGREAYGERFRGSAMQRAGRGGLKRNAANAMGNRGDARYVGALARALGGEEDPVVRATAAWSLGRIGGPAARAALRRAAAGEADPEVRREIAEALAGAAAGAPAGPANSA